MTVDSVAILVEVAMRPALHLSETSRSFNSTVLLDAICTLLLSHFRSSSSVREKLRENTCIFRLCSAVTVVSPLLQLLAENEQRLHPMDEETVLGALIETLDRYLLAEQVPLIPILVEGLRDAIPPHNNSSEHKANEMMLEKLCSKVGRSWRNSLLVGSKATESGFGRALSLIGQELLRTPSELTPLSLFGFVAGQDADFEGGGLELVPRAPTTLAVIAVLQLSLHSMTLNHTEPVLSEDPIFLRIAPLLLLRRMPASLFRLVMRETPTPSCKLFSLAAAVGKQLVLRLGILKPGYGPLVLFTSEERRLAAEVASRLLPLGDSIDQGRIADTKPPSCFDLICYPAFKGLSDALCESDGNIDLLLRRIRSARAGLFVACSAIPFADGSCNGGFLLCIAAFVFELLSLETENIAVDVMEDFQQLQTGCVEFIAVCEQRLLRCHLAEANCFTTLMLTVPSRGTYCLCYAAREISNTVRDILQTGRSGAKWLQSFNRRSEQSPLAMDADVAIQVQTRLWSSLLLAAQRCEAGHLHELASTNFFWIVAWITKEPYATSLLHPLCLAAAMQTVFVLLMRTASLEFVASAKSRQRATQKLHRFVVDLMKAGMTENGQKAILAVRLAALTLMLALVSVESVACLTPAEVMESFALVQYLAISDPDGQMQQISIQILSILRLMNTRV
jgi:hypothetical protein